MALRSQSTIKIQKPLSTSNHIANLTFIANGNIETNSITANGNINLQSLEGSITTEQITAPPSISGTTGNISVASPISSIKTGAYSSSSDTESTGGNINLVAGGTVL